MRIQSPLERGVAWLLFLLLVGGAAASIAFDRDAPDPVPVTAEDEPDDTVEDTPAVEPEEAAAAPAAEPGPRIFTIAATGDLLIHESVADAARTADGWDFSPMFTHVAPILSAADLAVCHVETPMSPNNAQLSYFPAFVVPRELASAIAYAGYDTCSLASNHATDGGQEGIVGTISALDRAGVAHAGMALSAEDRHRITLVEAGDATVAHLSYSYGFTNRQLPADEPYLSNLIDEETILDEARRARTEGADFVVLSMHWGANYEAAPDELQTTLGPRILASPDVDLILGHHSHVVQPVARIGDEFLVYGMGNFLSNQSPESCDVCPVSTQDGVIVHLTVTEDTASGRWRVTDISHTPTWVDRANYEIIDVLRGSGRDPALMAESAQRTASAIEALGIAVAPR
ncbi:MAG: CapA family protein [Acidimicrobiaceae bacterium]|nr:CapA family protein [Acidimicrobiaceae bacterium]MYA13205.1 CapA family protein [Acidimicrobiaceae bacterium]MYE64648.1 CapA family protein [Acidimicrobiaceae bacterium]